MGGRTIWVVAIKEITVNVKGWKISEKYNCCKTTFYILFVSAGYGVAPWL